MPQADGTFLICSLTFCPSADCFSVSFFPFILCRPQLHGRPEEASLFALLRHLVELTDHTVRLTSAHPLNSATFVAMTDATTHRPTVCAASEAECLLTVKRLGALETSERLTSFVKRNDRSLTAFFTKTGLDHAASGQGSTA
ncbi:unnamed protein product, partial [Protopolystoma xenopodis]